MLTAKEVAKMLNCSLFFVYKNFKQLGGFKIGRLTRFRKEKLLERLEEMEKGELNGDLETSRELQV